MDGNNRSSPSLIEPTRKHERIDSLDLLRGFALLGILVVNIQAFAMIGSSYNNPTAFGDFRGMNFLVWSITYIFFDSKMMAVFSMLFGAGVVLMADRVSQRGGNPFWVHLPRMLWLLFFGLAHAHFVWFGDILVAYAICGILVFFLRKLGPALLITGGIGLILVPVLLYTLFGLSQNYFPPEEFAELRADWQPSAEVINQEINDYRGSWLEQMPRRSKTAMFMETFVFGILFFWRATGLMLIGMALYKLGVLSGIRSSRFYLRGAVISLAIGFAIVGFGYRQLVSRQFAFDYSMFFGIIPNYVGSVLVTFGYICLIVLFAKCNCLDSFKHAIKSVGQMALTNYLLQSLIATAIFYGHGLGFFGQVSRTGQFGIVIAIWIAQIIWSPLWLAKFRFGPFEWLWRSLAYGKFQPLVRVKDNNT